MPSKSNPTFSVLTTTTNKPSRLALSSGVSALPTCGARAISSEPLCWGNSGGGVVVVVGYLAVGIELGEELRAVVHVVASAVGQQCGLHVEKRAREVEAVPRQVLLLRLDQDEVARCLEPEDQPALEFTQVCGREEGKRGRGATHAKPPFGVSTTASPPNFRTMDLMRTN